MTIGNTRSAFNIALVSALLLAMPLTNGCKQREEQPPAGTPRAAAEKEPEVDVAELMQNVRQTYAAMNSYADHGQIVERSVSRARGTQVETPFTFLALAFERPNKLSLSYEDAISGSQQKVHYRIASNGQLIRSEVSDLPDQIQQAEAPEELTTENLIPDPSMRAAFLQVALENIFPQLVMLLSDGSLEDVFPRHTEMRLLSDESWDGVTCFRVSLKEPEGNRVLWIEKDSLLLRRMEIPIDAQRELLDPSGQFSKFTDSIDLEEITTDVSMDDGVFEMKVPEEKRLVSEFVIPPALELDERLGKPAGEFTFTTLESEKVTPQDLKGKISFLEFWSTNCPPCRAQTPILDEVYQQFADEEDMVFYAVSTDARRISDNVVAETSASWGGNMPVLRDLEHDAYHHLGVSATPTLILLDKAGTVQMVHLGMIRSADYLKEKLEQLAEGIDLVDLLRQEQEERMHEFEELLESVTIRENGMAEEGRGQ